MNKKDLMYQRINVHGNNLLSLFPDAIEKDPVKLCKKLFSLENKAHRIATDWCNGVIETEDIDGVDGIDKIVAPILSKVRAILGNDCPVIFNGDCRGYALKIRENIMREKGINLYQDMGGYGILAPDFRE